jgi:hypothetical protein
MTDRNGKHFSAGFDFGWWVGMCVTVFAMVVSSRLPI